MRGGLGPTVLSKLIKNESMKTRFHNLGFGWDGKKMMVVDVEDSKVVVSGKDHTPPCEAWRKQKDLLAAFSGLAEHPDTRDIVTECMFQAYKGASANFTSDAIHTLGLFGLVTHLHHWMPAHGSPAWKESLAECGSGSTSEEQDCKLAVSMAQKFSAKSHCNKDQLRGYLKDAKHDGLSGLDTTVEL